MSKATWLALEQLENGSEEHVAKRYQVKAKPKFSDGEHKLDTTYATEHEAKARAKVLKDAGHDTEIVPPTEALEPPLSYARFRVEKQLAATAPFAIESSYPTEADAQARAREIDDEDVYGTDVRIVDSKDGSVIQLVYPDGTAVVPEADPVTEDQRAQQAQAEQNQQYLALPGKTTAPTTAIDPAANIGQANVAGAVYGYVPGSEQFPAHPAIENQPPVPAANIAETPQHEWLRKEKEAKEQHAG